MRLHYENLREKSQKHGPGKRFRGPRPPTQRGRPACAETCLAGHRLAPPLLGQRESRRGVPGDGAVPTLALPLPCSPASSGASCAGAPRIRRHRAGSWGRPHATGRSRAAAAGGAHSSSGSGFPPRSFSVPPPDGPYRPFPAQLGRSLGSGVGGGHQLLEASRDRSPWQHSGASSACLRPRFLQSRRRQLGRAPLPGQVALDCRAALAPGRSWGRLLQVYPSSSPRGPQYKCVWWL